MEIRSYKGKIKANLYDKKIPKESSQCIYLSVILIDSVYKKDKNYYPQLFLEICKYVVQEKNMSIFITDNIEISSDDSDKEGSNEEPSEEENPKQKHFSRKMLEKI